VGVYVEVKVGFAVVVDVSIIVGVVVGEYIGELVNVGDGCAVTPIVGELETVGVIVDCGGVVDEGLRLVGGGVAISVGDEAMAC
jgi:hypothetical protein